MLAAEVAKAGLKIGMNRIYAGVFPREITTQKSQDNQKSVMAKEYKGGGVLP
ncbi:hypothetical protein K432DRAFT_385108 [Lepidopterella palustris CBS 459.81]|uniref:Uncharacterized protein n=1 Tax=Lepidopterella palustris CBS 459.81 TaxID=1314670 RepID=A0A8E2E3V7_9PEZI|nr:hypothetical protein K432DRAFT_385108 [Lepidopterella palustris CBS 459.81]